LKKAYILGHPLGHSLSPIMHNAAFKHLVIDARYLKKDVLAEDLPKAIESLRRSDVFGANVTIPHKLAVMPFMDSISEAAGAIGAVNTIVNNNGSLFGHNTDAGGYLKALKENAGFEPRGKIALILGAGGSARAVAYSLLKAGVEALYIYNRRYERAGLLADNFKEFGNIKAILKKELKQKLESCDLLVNTTPVGMEHEGEDPDISPIEILPNSGFVSDIIYRPAKTKLLRDAEAAGLATQNGLPMLVYQGAEAFEMWTQKTAPVELMFKAALAALNNYEL